MGDILVLNQNHKSEKAIKTRNNPNQEILTQDSPWVRRQLSVLTWAPPTPVSESSSTARWRSSPMTRGTGPRLPMLPSLTPRDSLETQPKTRYELLAPAIAGQCCVGASSSFLMVFWPGNLILILLKLSTCHQF